ncbi:MAG TPA: phosphoribosylformylglycinamidine synthase subunit PurQ [Candidatus Methanomethylophilaceae archaeon]|nr:phosphoribosylformylglycinamidine synthase subunit PurQ [Candidatus Methanomethylophilaceae archaeon]
MKVCIMRIEGTNCEDETYNACKAAGCNPELVHLNQLTGHAKDRRDLEEYDALAFPGGFSAGDYVRAGAIFAARVKSSLGKEMRTFVEAEKPIIGICNGFQILVELGLLPATDGISKVPTAALFTNDSGRFECRPTYLKNQGGGKCLFTRKIPRGKVVMFPSAHAEGKLMGDNDRFLDRLEENGQIVFRYVNPDGRPSGYPWNPNGSPGNVAGICNPSGNVLGLMPHPERALDPLTAPDWTRHKKKEGDGMAIFRSMVDSLCR